MAIVGFRVNRFILCLFDVRGAVSCIGSMILVSLVRCSYTLRLGLYYSDGEGGLGNFIHSAVLSNGVIILTVNVFVYAIVSKEYLCWELGM